MGEVNVKVIFAEDYKSMTKEEFSDYIKKIYNEGYSDGFIKGCNTASTSISGTYTRSGGVTLLNSIPTNDPYSNKLV